MKFTTYTHKGGRADNQDFLACRNKNGIYCFAVADGFGLNGAVAARLAVTSVLDAFEENPSLDLPHSYIESAQRALLIKKSEAADFDDMGTTLAMLVTDGSDAVWAAVGDTRIYVLRRGKIIEVSEDHSVSFEKFSRGEIEYNDIRSDKDSNKLHKALGDRLAWEPDISAKFPITSAHSFLLCTDGFWRNISETEIEFMRILSLSSKGWLGKMLKKIAPLLGDRSDNLSAAAITMQHGDAY